MSLKIATGEYMISDSRGIGPRLSWFPRIVAEAFLESKKDGEIRISPDPVPMIEGDVSWFNDTEDSQDIWMIVRRAPRSIVAQSPATVVIHDAWSWQVSENPNADYPGVSQDTFGGRCAIDRASVASSDLQYGRFFLDGDDTQAFVHVGEVKPEQGFHFRYLAAVQTPGVWTEPTDFDARWEANARWTRLLALASPIREAASDEYASETEFTSEVISSL